MSNELNEQLATVDIKLDRPRKLKFTLRAIFELEKALGKKILPLLVNFWQQQASTTDESKLSLLFLETFGFQEIHVMLWAGLLHEDRFLTLEKTEELFMLADADNVSEKFGLVSGLVLKAFGLFMGQSKKKESKEITNLSPSNGTGSESATLPSARSSSSLGSFLS